MLEDWGIGLITSYFGVIYIRFCSGHTVASFLPTEAEFFLLRRLLSCYKLDTSIIARSH